MIGRILILFFAALLAPATASSAALPPRTEYEAERQVTSGVQVGPDRTYGTAAAEASGRRAVELENPRQTIEFTLRRPARGLTVRYSLPRSPADGRLAARLAISANGRLIADVPLISAYSAEPAELPPHARPNAPVHHWWDEKRVLLGRSLAAGTKLALRMSKRGAPVPFAVDLIDADDVPAPLARPARALSLLGFGADATGSRSSRDAMARAVAAAREQRRTLYVPPGRYHVDGHIVVDRVRIVGAGPWYSRIAGHGIGFYSNPAGSRDVALSGLAVESDVRTRQDRLPLAAIGGRFSNSTFSNFIFTTPRSAFGSTARRTML